MLTYGEQISCDETKLPQVSIHALITRGWSHFMGNEQASKVTAKIRTAIATNLSTPDKEVNQVDVTKEQVSAYRADNVSQVEAWENSVRQEALEKLMAGTVGVSVRGPAKDPVESAMATIARKEIATIFTSQGVKVPKGEETVTVGTGEAAVTLPMEGWIARRLASHRDRIRKEAERNLAEAAWKAKRLQEEAGKVAAQGPVTAEALGL